MKTLQEKFIYNQIQTLTCNGGKYTVETDSCEKNFYWVLLQEHK